MNRKLRKRVVLVSVALTMSAGWAAAHEGHTHRTQGTVKAVAVDRLDLEQQEGKVESFVLTSATKYLRGQAAEKHEGVRVGERAVVDYEEREGRRIAKEVRLGERRERGK